MKLIIKLSAIILATSLFVNCKKEYLTQEDLDNSLKGIEQPSTNFKNWELVINQTYISTEHWLDSINRIKLSFPIIHQDINLCRVDNLNYNYFWSINKSSIYLDLDTNLLTGLTRRNITLDSVNYPYLSELYKLNLYEDRLDLINVSKTNLIVYSKSLNRNLKFKRND